MASGAGDGVAPAASPKNSNAEVFASVFDDITASWARLGASGTPRVAVDNSVREFVAVRVDADGSRGRAHEDECFRRFRATGCSANDGASCRVLARGAPIVNNLIANARDGSDRRGAVPTSATSSGYKLDAQL
jgi:hypothetical protein